MRWSARLYAGGTPDKADDAYWEDGTIPWLNSGAVNQELITEPSAYISELGYANSSAKWVPKDALVIALAGQGKTKGMVAQLAIAATCNQSMAAIVPRAGLKARFLFWWLTSQYSILRNLAGGEARDGLNLEILGSLPLPIPPSPEQRAIADFLDAKTARTDALVTKKRELIEKLKEKRAALISLTVTHGLPPEAARAAGLDPHLRFKPSGVEWLGDVPEHWRVKAFKRICARVDVGIAEAATHAYSDEGVPIIRSTDVHAGFLDTSQLLKISEWFAAKNRSKTLHVGDLVTVRTGHPGTTAEIPPELDGCQCFTLVMSTLKANESSRYYCYFFNSNAGFTYFQLEGWGTAQTNISVPIVQEMSILEPPPLEQQAISEYLDDKTARIDELTAQVVAAIDRLHEYRSALITAAVTGKIDVRGAAASAASAIPEAAA